jgi:hypothetical protein
MYLAQQKAAADAAHYAAEREAAGWALKLTPEFLEYTFLQVLSCLLCCTAVQCT